MTVDGPPPRRNVLFLLADQLQAWALGCMGHPDITTPNLDALAAGGTLFSDAYVEYPVCTQYRGVLHTGRYGSQSGITEFGQGPAPGTPCLADALRGMGLWTSYVGKWHLYEFFDAPVQPQQRCGFERFVGYQSYNSYLSGTRFWDEELTPIELVGTHRTVATADLAIERLREIPDDRDFAMFVSFLSPHYPLEPLPGFEAMYRGTDITLRPNVREPEQLFTPTWSPRSPRPIETDPNYQRYGRSIEDFWRFYAAMVSMLDHEIGRVLAELRALGRDDGTLVIFTSDHGEMGGSHGLMNKRVWHEESVRVPFLVRCPGAPAARIATPISAGVDVWPSLVDWLGGDPDPRLPGESLMEMVRGGAARDHHPAVAELAGDDGYVMVRDGDWKYVCAHADGTPIALHDVSGDPYEQENVLGDAPEVVERLAERVVSWRQTIGHGSPT